MSFVKRGRINKYKRTRAYAHSIDDFRRCCELVLTAKGFHGRGEVVVYEYPFKRTQFEGIWVKYQIEMTEGEPQWPEPLIGIETAKEFIEEVGYTLGQYHTGEPARWECYAFAITARDTLREIGEKALSSSRSVEDASGQTLGAIDDWLEGITYSSSDVGAIRALWLKARLSVEQSR